VIALEGVCSAVRQQPDDRMLSNVQNKRNKTKKLRILNLKLKSLHPVKYIFELFLFFFNSKKREKYRNTFIYIPFSPRGGEGGARTFDFLRDSFGSLFALLRESNSDFLVREI